MFYALGDQKVRSSRVTFRHVLEDIETLNRKAMEGVYDLSAISYHAYPYVADKYVLMASGLHRRRLWPDDHLQPPMEPEETQGQAHRHPRHADHRVPRVQALPAGFRGRRLAVRQITDAVRERTVDAGLIIHEAQLTFDREGFHRIVDLGRWLKSTYDLPLPLGGNVLLRSLYADVKSECCRTTRESIQYALDNHDEALDTRCSSRAIWSSGWRRSSSACTSITTRWTPARWSRRPRRSCSTSGYEAGLIPKRVELEFVREPRVIGGLKLAGAVECPLKPGDHSHTHRAREARRDVRVAVRVEIVLRVEQVLDVRLQTQLLGQRDRTPRHPPACNPAA